MTLSFSFNKTFLIALLLIIANSTTSYSQNSIRFSGVIYDINLNKLAEANLLFQPLTTDKSPLFTTSNNSGEFSIDLTSKDYILKVSYLGYKSVEIDISKLDSNFTEIYLEENLEEINEVVLNYTPEKIAVKIDTLIYDVSKFTDGSEYKMKDVLNKLPGVVYEDGELTVSGKKIKRVLVEGDKFFSGGTRLAVDNIPAEVIDEIEIIDDFSAVSFMKNVSDSDETILNVKLKEDKKSFWFGDLNIAYGNNNYHNVKPSVFKYDRDNSFVFLLSKNNYGEPLSNIGSLSGLNTNTKNTINNYNFDPHLFRYNLPIKDVESTNNFAGAFGFRNRLTKKVVVNGYLIGEGLMRRYDTNRKNQYFLGDEAIIETVIDKKLEEDNFLKGNLEMSYLVSSNEELFFNFNINSTSPLTRNNLLSTSNTSQINIYQFADIGSLTIDNNLSWFKKYSTKFIAKLEIDIENNFFEESLEFSSSDNLFDGINIGFDDTTYLLQNNNIQYEQYKFLGTGFYKINNYHSLSAELSGRRSTGNLNSTITNTEDFELSNTQFRDESVKIIDYKLLPGYLFKKNNLSVSTNFGITKRRINNFDDLLISYLFKTEFKKSFGNEISLEYQYNNEFPRISNYYDSNILKNYNLIIVGNEDLISPEYHKINLNSSISKFSKGFTLWGFLEYKYFTKSILLNTTINNQNSLTRLQNTDELKSEFQLKFTFGKVFKSFRLNISPSYQNNIQPLISNSQQIQSESTYFRVKTTAATNFKNLPNVEVNYSIGFKENKTQFIERDFISNAVDVSLFRIKGNFQYRIKYNYYLEQNSFSESFHNIQLNASYDFENSPWRLYIKAENLLNDRVISNNFIGNNFISETRIRRLPRVMLLGILYKF